MFCENQRITVLTSYKTVMLAGLWKNYTYLVKRNFRTLRYEEGQYQNFAMP